MIWYDFCSVVFDCHVVSGYKVKAAGNGVVDYGGSMSSGSCSLFVYYTERATIEEAHLPRYCTLPDQLPYIITQPKLAFLILF